MGMPSAGFPFFCKGLLLMTAKCPQCGFRADLLTETTFHTCSQCSAVFRVYHGRSISEQYFRHEPDESLAWGALLGFLDAEGFCIPSRRGEIAFAYHPFWLADKADGGTLFKAAAPLPENFQSPSSPPAGDLEFAKKDPSLSPSVTDPQQAFPETIELKRLRLLQVPLYLINYEVAAEKYQATVSGCTWQIHASRLPQEGGLHIPWPRMTFLAVYLTALLVAGVLAPNIVWRLSMLVVILLAAWALERSGFGRG